MDNKDNLENLGNEIKDYAESKGIKVIEGFFIKETNQIISKKEDFKEFLDLVADSNPKYIILDIKEFNESFFESEKEIKENSDKINQIKEKYKIYVEKPFQIRIGWLKEGFSISFEETADWFVEFMAEQEEIETIEQDDKLSVCEECGEKFRDFKLGFLDSSEVEKVCPKCKSKKQKEAEEIIKEISEKLSEEDAFIKCKNSFEREFYLEKNYPDIIKNEFISISKLTQRAKALKDFKARKI